MLTDSYDIILGDFLRNHLREGDVFVDVGANIGYVSALAASHVGTSGEVHGFETLKGVLRTAGSIERTQPGLLFCLQQRGVGQTEGCLPISYNPHGDSRNATLIPGCTHAAASYDVPVIRLDNYLLRKCVHQSASKRSRLTWRGSNSRCCSGSSGF